MANDFVWEAHVNLTWDNERDSVLVGIFRFERDAKEAAEKYATAFPAQVKTEAYALPVEIGEADDPTNHYIYELATEDGGDL